mgnify:CR=1 FL=1
MSNGSVSVAKVAQVLNLKNFTPDINLKKCKIISSDVNRPALQLTGYFEHFEESRIQMIGNVEYTFIQQMSDAEKKTRYDAFLKFDIPCVIFCRSLQPDEIFLEEAIKNGFQPVTLGESRLRTETAALAACHSIHVLNW